MNTNASLNFDIAGGTECGASRPINQDAFFISQDKCLLIVADGHSRSATSSGVDASRLAVEAIAKQWDAHRPDLSQNTDIHKWLQSSIQDANELLYAELLAKNINAYCTIVVAVLSESGSVHITHAGDARACALKQGELTALTEDHTFLNTLKREAPDTYEKITTQRANVCYTPHLMRAIGFSEEITADLTTAQLAKGDWLILCTNGLYEFVSDESIAETLSKCSSAEEACKLLFETTKEADAYDDVTVIAARCV